MPQDPAQTGATATPKAPEGQTGPTNDGQTGPLQTGATGAAQTGPVQTGAAQTGAAQTGPSGAPAGPTLDTLKKTLDDALAAYEKDKTPELKAAAEAAKLAMKEALGQKAPEKYELKLPKDSVLDTAHLERIAAEAKAQGLSNAEAQALLERDNGLFSVFAKEEKARVEGYIAGWLDDSKSDKEIGGSDEVFKKNAELSFRVIKKFGTPALVQALSETGLGNHPELVRVFVKIGKAMGDDKFETPSGQAQPETSLADKFYGEPKPKPNQE